jgi:hypothetical protein
MKGDPTSDPGRRPGSDRVGDLPEEIRRVHWRLRQLLREAGTLEERLDEAFWRLSLVVDRLDHRQAGAGTAPPVRGTRSAGPRRLLARCQADASESRLESLWAKRQPDGSLWVRVDKGTVFPLPRHLGELLLVLAEDNGVSDDECVGWKTLDDISDRMKVLCGGKRLNRDTLNKYIHQLRKALAIRGGLEHDPVQVSRTKGRRLALRRHLGDEEEKG